MPPPVSLTVIARNEEATLAACLRSARDLLADAVVVDTGSTDRTREIAVARGARVFDFPWCDDFAAARNEALRHATQPWAFWLDADESLDEDNRRKLRDLFAALPAGDAAFSMKQRSAHERGGSATLVDQVRLFRHCPEVRWRYRVHEQVLPALRAAGHPVHFTDIAIDHGGYVELALRRRKTERNLRLLELEHAERPDEPFTLFNLGWAHLELGRAAEALPALQRSLRRSQPDDSIVRKTYTLLVQCHRQLGQGPEAAAACRAGLARHPDAAELLFLDGALRRERGDAAGAERRWRQLLQGQPLPCFASYDADLRGARTRHHLALLYRDQGRAAEAEQQWRAALAEQPAFELAWQGLAELLLRQGRWAELEDCLGRLAQVPGLDYDAGVLRARAHLACRRPGDARPLLEQAVARRPEALGPRVLLTHALLQEGHDEVAAEEALRDVVARAPQEAESWRNLALLWRKQGRHAEAATACRSGLAHCPNDAALLLLHGRVLVEMGDLLGAEACLLRVLELPPESGADNAGELGGSARHQLALLYREQKRLAQAEAQWRAVLADWPLHKGAWLGLGELYLEAGRWADLEAVAGRLGELPDGGTEGVLLRARGLLARQEHARARELAEAAVAEAPGALRPRVLLSHVLLQEGRDFPAAERALRAVLELAPEHAEARRNLALLLSRAGFGGAPRGAAG
jgi:tetratricopeptide (TPR) repeat protein